jgi:hypothetical protein
MILNLSEVIAKIVDGLKILPLNFHFMNKLLSVANSNL